MSVEIEQSSSNQTSTNGKTKKGHARFKELLGATSSTSKRGYSRFKELLGSKK